METEDKRLQRFIDKHAPGSTAEEIMNTRHYWPPEIERMFPLWLCFYRPKSGRNRRNKDGGYVPNDINPKTGKIRLKTLYKEFKSKKSREMNNYNLMIAYCHSPNDFGTIRRITKHRGYRNLVAAYYPTQEEEETEKTDIQKTEGRYVFYKYKDFWQLYLLRKYYDSEFEDLMNRCENLYPCKSSGQRRLF